MPCNFKYIDIVVEIASHTNERQYFCSTKQSHSYSLWPLPAALVLLQRSLLAYRGESHCEVIVGSNEQHVDVACPRMKGSLLFFPRSWLRWKASYHWCFRAFLDLINAALPSKFIARDYSFNIALKHWKNHGGKLHQPQLFPRNNFKRMGGGF